MEISKKRVLLPVFISIAVFLMLVFTSAYAYYAASTNANVSTNISANLPTATTIFTTASNCVLDLTSADMTLENVDTSFSDTCYLNVTINGGAGGYCTYDVLLEEVGTDTYIRSAGVGTAPYVFEYTGAISGAATKAETQLDSLKGTRIVTNKLITIASDGVEVTQTYNMIEKWYNLNIDQDSHAGKVYSYKFSVTNISC